MPKVPRASLWAAVGLALALPGAPPAAAQGPQSAEPRRIEFRFTPTDRAQLALWIEGADGTFMGTVRLTEAVGFRGIGNRPGATQMNTGFRYPYGRREGVLPVWAHRRYQATSELFPRVMFYGRTSTDGVHAGEGYASIYGDPAGSNTVDNFFCLSFTDTNNDLDAVSCASVFRSNKGRYVRPEDVDTGYAVEPWQDTAGNSEWRDLSRGSLYPPRRDLGTCSATCTDHPDAFRFAEDARAIMPEIDVVTMATLPGDMPYVVRYTAPPEWPAGDYVAFLEVHVEADYNEFYNPEIYGEPAPNPSGGDAFWDFWSHSKGVSYRGQPSVVFRVPFSIHPRGGEWSADAPFGFSDLHGVDGDMTPMPDAQITDDPMVDPGSGADRLRARADGSRFLVVVRPSNICLQPDPPSLCGEPCTSTADCASQGLDCNPESICADPCDDSFPAPPVVSSLEIATHADEKHSHEWATLRFAVPESARPITRYQVKFGVRPPPANGNASDLLAWFNTLEDAKAPSLDSEMLQILDVDAQGDPIPLPAGANVEVDVGQLTPQVRYHFAIRAIDSCEHIGPIATTEVVTTAIHFETVSPCFVATAAYGSPMADEIGALRRLRDRHLATNTPGRWLVDVYETVGPDLADIIRRSPALRAVARTGLTPIVHLAMLLDD